MYWEGKSGEKRGRVRETSPFGFRFLDLLLLEPSLESRNVSVRAEMCVNEVGAYGSSLAWICWREKFSEINRGCESHRPPSSASRVAHARARACLHLRDGERQKRLPEKRRVSRHCTLVDPFFLAMGHRPDPWMEENWSKSLGPSDGPLGADGNRSWALGSQWRGGLWATEILRATESIVGSVVE